MSRLKNKTFALLILIFASCLAGCGKDSHEKIFSDSADLNNEVADMMEAIADGSIDDATAQSIMDGLEKTKQAIDKRMAKLGAPSKEEFARILQSEELRESLGRLGPAMIKAISSGKVTTELAKRMSALAEKSK